MAEHLSKALPDEEQAGSKKISGGNASGDVTETVRLRWYYRHPVAVRFNHWINAICLLILLMSGLQIFNAHPALYWGMVSTFDTPLVSIKAKTICRKA